MPSSCIVFDQDVAMIGIDVYSTPVGEQVRGRGANQ